MNHATDKQPAPIKKSKMNIRQKETIHGLLFISPWVIGFLIFTLYPICSSLYYSLCEYQVIKDPVFIGFDNYNLNSALNYNEEGTGTFILNALKIAL